MKQKSQIDCQFEKLKAIRVKERKNEPESERLEVREITSATVTLKNVVVELEVEQSL